MPLFTELKKIAPKMNCLEMESAVEYDKIKKLTKSWLEKHGTKLNGIVSSEPGDAVKGVCDVVDTLNRKDLIIVSAGNSLATQDLVKQGRLHAITYQSAESDGALAIKMAIDWLDGINVPPARYLPSTTYTSR